MTRGTPIALRSGVTEARTVYRVLQQAAPERLAQLARDEFRYGAKILYVDGPPPAKPVQVDGIVVHSTLEEAAYYIGTSNPLLEHLEAFRRIEHDKYFEAELVRGVVPAAYARTELVSHIWPAAAGGDAPSAEVRLRRLEAEMHARYPGGFVLKPISSFSTDGQFPSERTPFAALYAAYLVEAKPAADALRAAKTDETEAHLQLKQLPSYPGRILDAVLHAPHTVMIQERLDIAEADGVIDEYRVHVVGGEVLEGATEHRWDNYRALAPAKIREAEAFVGAVMQKLPAPYNALTYGCDVVRLTDGSLRLMECNPGWESQYFYAEFDVWVANVLAARYAGAPTTLLNKFRRFQRARSIPTKLGHLRQLLAHRALRDGDKASVTELHAQAAHVLIDELPRISAADCELVVAAIADLGLDPYLSLGELDTLAQAQQRVAATAAAAAAAA